MFQVSRYERQLIADALGSNRPPCDPDVVIVLLPDALEIERIADAAIHPALVSCGFRSVSRQAVFDSSSWLGDVAHVIQSAELLIADTTGRNPDVMYALGLAHGLGRCPLLVGQDLDQLPFGLRSMRCVDYINGVRGLWEFRENLARAIRVYQSAMAASRIAERGSSD